MKLPMQHFSIGTVGATGIALMVLHLTGNLIGWACLGLCWWVFAFIVGFFQTIMCSLIITACFGIYFSLNWRL